eukprot:TRINITY_DN6594_c0_g1_i1.p1 TRINITY_DN6594_c0_g1~~TRINITY_DN6594_c0_g1_i1.p1  ORF type:complete len:398 (+),score=119.10 TRINITY_DN6594_c0_g1_i1:25-1194(+)
MALPRGVNVSTLVIGALMLLEVFCFHWFWLCRVLPRGSAARQRLESPFPDGARMPCTAPQPTSPPAPVDVAALLDPEQEDVHTELPPPDDSEPDIPVTQLPQPQQQTLPQLPPLQPARGSGNRAVLSWGGIPTERALLRQLCDTKGASGSTQLQPLPKRPRVAVVSASFGTLDTISSLYAGQLEADTDYFMFTDNGTQARNSTWNLMQLNVPRHDLSNNRLRAKYFKMQMFRLLPGYDVYIWLDAKYRIKNTGVVRFLLDKLNNNSALIAISRHNKRSTAYAEMKYCTESRKKYFKQRFREEPLREQYDYYKKNGFTDSVGLYHGGVFAVRNTPCMWSFFDRWWIENVCWSVKDQVSLSYLLELYDIKPTPFKYELRDFLAGSKHKALA